MATTDGRGTVRTFRQNVSTMADDAFDTSEVTGVDDTCGDWCHCMEDFTEAVRQLDEEDLKLLLEMARHLTYLRSSLKKL